MIWFRGRKNCQRISENRRIKRSRESGFSLTRYLLWCVYFVTKLDPEKIITDGEDKTATNMNDQTLWTRLWLIEENEDNVVAVVFDLETFSMEGYTKVK